MLMLRSIAATLAVSVSFASGAVITASKVTVANLPAGPQIQTADPTLATVAETNAQYSAVPALTRSVLSQTVTTVTGFELTDVYVKYNSPGTSSVTFNIYQLGGTIPDANYTPPATPLLTGTFTPPAGTGEELRLTFDSNITLSAASIYSFEYVTTTASGITLQRTGSDANSTYVQGGGFAALDSTSVHGRINGSTVGRDFSLSLYSGGVAAPEPGTLGLLALGGLAVLRRRR